MFIFLWLKIKKDKYKSKELNHLHLHTVLIFLFKSFYKNFSSLLTFLWSLLFIKCIASQSQVAHNCIIDIKEIEYRKYDHKNGEDINNFIRNCDLSKEFLELSLLDRGQLKIVITKWIADSGHVHRRKE